MRSVLKFALLAAFAVAGMNVAAAQTPSPKGAKVYIINLKDENRQRLIEVDWGDANILTYPVNLLIQAVDRTGLLSDITRTLADEKVNVIAVNTLSDKKHQTARMAVTVEIQDLQQLNRIMDKVGQLPNVTEVQRGSNTRNA